MTIEIDLRIVNDSLEYLSEMNVNPLIKVNLMSPLTPQLKDNESLLTEDTFYKGTKKYYLLEKNLSKFWVEFLENLKIKEDLKDFKND